MQLRQCSSSPGQPSLRDGKSFSCAAVLLHVGRRCSGHCQAAGLQLAADGASTRMAAAAAWRTVQLGIAKVSAASLSCCALGTAASAGLLDCR